MITNIAEYQKKYQKEYYQKNKELVKERRKIIKHGEFRYIAVSEDQTFLFRNYNEIAEKFNIKPERARYCNVNNIPIMGFWLDDFDDR